MRLVFLSRSFPPILGGLEKQNAELLRALESKADVASILNTRGKNFLPVFLPAALTRLLIAGRHADAVLLGDAATAPLGAVVKAVYGTPVFCIAHGLDVSYDNALYRELVVRRSLPRMDRIFAVGNATRELVIAKGIPAEKVSFIPNGVRPREGAPGPTPDSLGFLEGKSFVLSLGRLVKRKGILWFLQNVYPGLRDVSYVIAGGGPEGGSIAREAAGRDNVHFLGVVDDVEKDWLLANAAVFVQPNIPVEHDIEGFGIAVLEASANGCVVVASRLEGLQDAIVDHRNGILVEPNDPKGFLEAVTSVLNSDDRASTAEAYRRYTLENYNWDGIADRYLAEMSSAIT